MASSCWAVVRRQKSSHDDGCSYCAWSSSCAVETDVEVACFSVRRTRGPEEETPVGLGFGSRTRARAHLLRAPLLLPLVVRCVLELVLGSHHHRSCSATCQTQHPARVSLPGWAGETHGTHTERERTARSNEEEGRAVSRRTLGWRRGERPWRLCVTLLDERVHAVRTYTRRDDAPCDGPRAPSHHPHDWCAPPAALTPARSIRRYMWGSAAGR